LLSKVTATYLPSSEWGLASAVGSIALTLGSASAPLLAGVMAVKADWRSAFVLAGVLGLVWIGLWQFAVRKIAPRTAGSSVGTSAAPPSGTASRGHLLRDIRLWRIVIAYALVLVLFMLWLNWTTIYFVQQYRLSQAEVNRFFAWLPPVFIALGGFFNGWLTFRWVRGGMSGLAARRRLCMLSSPIFFLAAATPFLPTARLGICGVCVSLFVCQNVVGSLNIMPVDLFGPERAAFTISVLACAYALMQTFISPLIGGAVDRYGFSMVCAIASLLPLLGIWAVKGISDESPKHE
jgi:MFS transporter, ACS family, hexuronate transporter